MHINIAKVDFGRYYCEGGVEYDSEYLTLSALEDGTITITIPSYVNQDYATSLSYSKDKSSWSEPVVIDDTDQTITIPVSSGDDVYLRGIARQLYNVNEDNGVYIDSSANINVSGNIMSLLYGDDFKDKTAFPNDSECTFKYLFSSNAHLINAEDLILPATTLTTRCYDCMFDGCSSLITTPSLPATELVDYCYQYMFYGCTSLTTAPELPTTTLASGCYQYMFYGCSKLNSITMLATNISASNCMRNWVSGVSSTGTFTKAASMTSLPTGTSGIPSGWTVVDYTDYLTLSALEDGEITITIPAAVNATYATSLSYSKDKSNWVETIVDDTDQTITIPVSTGDKVYLKGKAKQWGYFDRGITYSTHIGLSTNIIASGNIMSLLYEGDFKDKTVFPVGSQYTFDGLFKGNSHLINVENLILPATALASDCYSNMFEGCTSLTTAPELPATTLADSCYCYMFYGCTSLTTSPTVLPATELAKRCYTHMFLSCSSLTAAPELPATTLAQDCYSYMFQGCTSLTTAPELPATTLVLDCYRGMFLNCSSLNNITMLATDISVPYCLFNWVSGIASTGTFTKAASMTTLPTGADGIPSGWTVVNK